MKTKKFKIVSFINVFLIVILVSFIGCQKEDKDIGNELPFLSIESSDINFSNLSNDELKTVSLALKRINIVTKHGFYKIKQKSGSEINISEKLFDYFNSIIYNSNHLIKSSKKINLSIPRLKSGSEAPPIPETDCVAHSISASMIHFGGSVSFETISSYLVSTYGSEGVRAENYVEAASHFLTGNDISGSVPTSYNYSSQGSQILIAVNLGGGKGHSGTLLYTDGYSCLYRDDQNGGDTQYCEYASIVKAFAATNMR
jgi:hypothetical protein